jgi:dTDP-4-amino-4,6-dideoxygalactose transaminase
LIPVMSPRLPELSKISKYLSKIDENRVYTNFGPLVQMLSEKLAEYFDVNRENILLMNNGTLALSGGVFTGSGTNDSWDLPAFTFVATEKAVCYASRAYSLHDVTENDWTLDSSVSDFTGKNVVATAPFGDDPFLIVNQFNGTDRLVIDAASCFDACRSMGKSTPINFLTMVSLHATKLVSTGEGAVLVGPSDWIEEVRKWSNFGFNGKRESEGSGINAKMSEYNAAVGLASLENWNDDRESWEISLNSYNNFARSLGWSLQPSVERGHVTSTCVLKVNSAVEKLVISQRFLNAGIETRDWWGKGLHHQFPMDGKILQDFPITDSIVNTTIGIPIYPGLPMKDLSLIKQILSDCKEYCDK